MAEPRLTEEKLFIANNELLLHQDPEVKLVTIPCNSFIRERYEHSVFAFHPLYSRLQPEPGEEHVRWPARTDIACWHDAHSFDTPPVPALRDFRKQRGIYYTYGIFCSVNCAKAFMIEHEPSLSSLRLMYFMQMCRQVYGLYGSIKPAPPRIRLEKFGGDVDIIAFRRNHDEIHAAVLEPPFVPFTLVLERKMPQTAAEAENVLHQMNAEEQPAPFDVFLANSTPEEVQLEEKQQLEIQKEKKKPKPSSKGKRKQPEAPKVKPVCTKRVKKPPQPKLRQKPQAPPPQVFKGSLSRFVSFRTPIAINRAAI